MEQKESAIKGYQIAVEKLSQINIDAIIFLLLFIILIVVGVLVYSSLSRKHREKYKYTEFVKFAKEKELSESEYKILWDYSLKLDRDPFLSLEFKSPFEKVVDLYIKENPQFDENLIKDMRKKLGFDYLPYFVPITTTKDIDLFQEGTLKISGMARAYRVALYDKDELYMYWVIIDSSGGANLSKNDEIKINFVRKSDAAYVVEAKVDDVFSENGRIIVKVPHTFEFTRIQRREYPRVECDIDAIVGKEVEGKLQWVEAKIMDISPSGAKVCINSEEKDRLGLKITDSIVIKFTLSDKDMLQKAEVVNIYEKQKVLCYGVKFLDIKDNVQRDIFDFVKKQQQNLAKLYAKQS